MENKNSPRGLAAFFAGKGFYIVLSLCLLIIGVTVWAMLTKAEKLTETEYETGYYDDWVDMAAYSAAEYTDESPVMAAAPETTDAGILFTESEESVSAEAEAEEVAEVWSADTAVSAPQQFYWPVNGAVEMEYSMDALVYNPTMSDWRTHSGVDIAAAIGTQVMASCGGRVESVYTDDLMGVTVVIDHMGGLKSIYCNLAGTPTVSVGDGVEAGQVIGAVGSSALAETAEAAHLHFAMTLDGQSVDPGNYMP